MEEKRIHQEIKNTIKEVVSYLDDNRLLELSEVPHTEIIDKTYPILMKYNYKDILDSLKNDRIDSQSLVKYISIYTKIQILAEIFRRKLMKFSDVFSDQLEILYTLRISPIIRFPKHFEKIRIDEELREDLIRVIKYYLKKLDEEKIRDLFGNIESIDIKKRRIKENISNEDLIKIAKKLYAYEKSEDKIIAKFSSIYLSYIFIKNFGIEDIYFLPKEKIKIEEKEEILYPFEINYKINYVKDDNGNIIFVIIDGIKYSIEKLPIKVIYNEEKYEIISNDLNENIVKIWENKLDILWTEKYIFHQYKKIESYINIVGDKKYVKLLFKNSNKSEIIIEK